MPYQLLELHRPAAWIDLRLSGTSERTSKLRGHPSKPETRYKTLSAYREAWKRRRCYLNQAMEMAVAPPLPLCPRRTRSLPVSRRLGNKMPASQTLGVSTLCASDGKTYARTQATRPGYGYLPF